MSFQNDAAGVPAGGRTSPRTGAPPVAGTTRPTRTAAVWAAVAVGLVVLVLLIVFFVQNQDMVTVRFFGLEGSLALGTTLFIAAVGGGVLVALAGGARILQLRIINHRRQRSLGSVPAGGSDTAPGRPEVAP
ncbi:LapA family protein [Paenarthrobacter sp. S56]|uniref:LapA family protein n=1 Tax=Paenarthrobacter sp. S56 TaxID=3138179 RepID=UPI00321A669D